jgi:hypothetical protein
MEEMFAGLMVGVDNLSDSHMEFFGDDVFK